MNSEFIIKNDDPRYGKLGHMWKNVKEYSRNEGINATYYLIPKELVLEDYSSGWINISKTPNESPDSWDNWINSKRLNKILSQCCNLSLEDYYDLLELHINNRSNRPRCPICGGILNFVRVISGYTKYCSLECRNESYRLPKVYLTKKELEYKYNNRLIDDKLIIPLSDERYSKLESIFNTYNYKNFQDGDGKNSLYYYIPPELVKYEYIGPSVRILKVKTKEKDFSKSWDNWISNKWAARYIAFTCQLTLQDYYDLLVLHNNNKLNRPICANPECNNRLSFVTPTLGYSTRLDSKLNFCSPECKDYYYGRNGKWGGIHPIYINVSKLVNPGYVKSGWEYDYILELEKDSNIKSIEYEPKKYIIDYISPEDNRVHKYHPDFLITDINGISKLIEVKPYSLLEDPINKSKFKAARLFCKSEGIEFEIVTEYELY